eukprot:531833_1
MGNKLQTRGKRSTPFWKSKSNSPDDFIIKFSQSYYSKQNRAIDTQSFDQKRIVFTSLIGLFQTYKNCPAHLLYTSIFVLPLKRNWLYNLSKYIDKSEYPLTEFVDLTIFNSGTETATFMDLLKWKDSQGLLFFMLDEYKTDETSLLHPFWAYFSNKLCTMHDTISGKKYNALTLDETWWEHNYKQKNVCKYGSKLSGVLSELYFLCMKYQTIKEIIYQSNPDTLKPITFYGENCDQFKRVSISELTDNIQSIQHDIDHNMESGEWYISVDYEM